MPGRTHALHRLSSSVLRKHIASYLLNVLFYVEATLGTTDNMKLPAIYGDMNKQDLLLKPPLTRIGMRVMSMVSSPPAKAVEAPSQISDI
jgi:hypothetical protein